MTDDKIVYPFVRSDGFVSPCRKGCPNCKHCTDVLWDYSNGIYRCFCEIYIVHDICCNEYENDGTKPITIEEFKKIKEKEDESIKGGLNNGNTK